MLGLRVGEVVGGGDFHGLLANNLTIIRRLGDGGPVGPEIVEGYLEHSKTKHPRWVSGLGLSKGSAGIELASLLRAYWRLAGWRIVTRHEDGYQVEGPDYTVLRLSLVALSTSAAGDRERIDLLHSVLSRSKCARAREWANFTRRRALERLTGDSLERRYVNVVGGSSDSPDLRTVAAELTRAGFDEPDRFRPVPGPLMRSSNGERMGYSDMPIQPSSTYDILHKAFDEAYQLANATSPDPELDLRGQPSPLWGHHSARRGADTVARQSREQTGATERDIDIVFGWMEAYYNSIMQLHYESHFDRERRAAVTSMW